MTARKMRAETVLTILATATIEVENISLSFFFFLVVVVRRGWKMIVRTMQRRGRARAKAKANLESQFAVAEASRTTLAGGGEDNMWHQQQWMRGRRRYCAHPPLHRYWKQGDKGKDWIERNNQTNSLVLGCVKYRQEPVGSVNHETWGLPIPASLMLVQEIKAIKTERLNVGAYFLLESL